MSIASLSAVTDRVNQIQKQFAHNTPRRVSFAETLQAAQQAPTAPSQDSFAVNPQGLATTRQDGFESVPIGIMGTPVTLQSGRAFTEFGSGDWISRLPAAGQAWAVDIAQAADAAELDPKLLAAMVWQESRFQPDAVSSSGAIGLAQLMPGTAAGLEVNPQDPVQNLNGGARYLAWTIAEFGSIELGLAAYNAGPGTVRESGGIPDIAETQAYVPRVLDYYRQLGGKV